MIRILLDQGLPRSTASHLQDEKWDILHVGDIGLSKAKDTELIEYARENGRVIIMRIPVKSATHSGGSRPPVPDEVGHPFRMIPATDSDGCRPVIPIDFGHPSLEH